jgi:hypothetical protein
MVLEVEGGEVPGGFDAGAFDGFRELEGAEGGLFGWGGWGYFLGGWWGGCWAEKARWGLGRWGVWDLVDRWRKGRSEYERRIGQVIGMTISVEEELRLRRVRGSCVISACSDLSLPS